MARPVCIPGTSAPRRSGRALAEACAKTEWQVHGIWLKSNHFHLVMETPQVNADCRPWFEKR